MAGAIDHGLENWGREAAALEKIGSRKIPHVIEVKAMLCQGPHRYLIFPWADGGNLFDFWTQYGGYEKRRDVARLIPKILEQLMGLASALVSLHDLSPDSDEFCRHSDLKPENILLFDLPRYCLNGLGTWKMADLGLAKFHTDATQARHNRTATSTRGFGTILYQPPEYAADPRPPTSRLVDIWSMGCIILQLVTWLVYGVDRVRELYRQTQAGFTASSMFWTGFFIRHEGRLESRFEVHYQVRRLMSDLRNDLKKSKVLLDLVQVVEEKLLVVALPSHHDEPGPECRTTARGLQSSLQKIHQSCVSDSAYWLSSWEAVKTHGTPRPMQALDVGEIHEERAVSQMSLIAILSISLHREIHVLRSQLAFHDSATTKTEL